MPPPTAPPQAPPTPEQALSALLTPDQLTELISLISAITTSMHAQLSDAFDTTVHTPITHPHERLQTDARNPDLATVSAGHEDTDAEVSAGMMQARREQELPETGLMDLKNDALEWFQGWRDGVVGMVVDALNAKDVGGERRGEFTGGEDDIEPPPEYEVYGESQCRIYPSHLYLSSIF
jgi:hypothetical protein